MYTAVTLRPLLQAAEQAQKLREARKEKADMEGNVNDMERAQDFLKAGNVKVLSLLSPVVHPPLNHIPAPHPFRGLGQRKVWAATAQASCVSCLKAYFCFFLCRWQRLLRS